MRKNLNKKLLTTIAILASASYPLTALAATTSTHNQDLVITVDNKPHKITPESLTIITEKDIATSGATDVYDLLKKMTFMNINANNHVGHNVSIRGMANNHTLILINGQRMAGEDVSRTQNAYELDRIPLTNIKEIKVISGAQSATYGSDALGGVIDILTKDYDTNKTTLELNTGTLYTGTGVHTSFVVSPKFTSNLDIHLTEKRKIKDSDNNYMFFGHRQSYNFTGKYKFDPEHNLVLNLGYYTANYQNQYADAKGSGPYMDVNKHEDLANKRFNSSLTYYGQNQNSDYHVGLAYSTLSKTKDLYNNPKAIPMANTGGHHHGSAPNNASAKPPSPPPKFDWDENKYKLFTIDGEKTTALGEKSVLTYGAKYEKVKIEGTRLASPNQQTITKTNNNAEATKQYGYRDQYRYGAFVEESYQLDPKLAVIGTLRFDHHSSFGNKATYRLGSIYELNKNQKLKFNFGTAYKAPSLSERYFYMYHPQSRKPVYIKGNPNLKPEEATNWDLSYELQHKHFTGKLTYFDNKVKNLIESQKTSPNVYTYENINNSRIKGVELSLVQDLGKQWQLRFDNTWLNAKNTNTKMDLDYRPHYKGALQLLFDDHKPQGFNGALTLNMVHHEPWSEKIHLKGGKVKTAYYHNTYQTLDFIINKKFSKGNFFLGVDNLTNKEVDNINLYGRLWKVGANWNF